MEFEKVEKEHILLGIKDFEEKGIPKGFGPSSTYDLVFEGKEYPPKAVMAYANYHASGKEISGYFKGGLGTDCFNAFERNGFDVISKDGESERSLFSIIEKLKSQIPENEFKFKTINERSKYVWVSDSENLIGRKDAHYEFILKKNSQRVDGQVRDEIFLELHFEKPSSQQIFKESLNVENSKIEWYDLKGTLRIQFLSSYILSEENIHLKMASDLRDFDKIIGDQVRSVIKALPVSVVNNRLSFKKYLESTSPDGSGKTSSYIRAIEVLSEFKDINKKLFETEETSFLKSLYEIVKSNQVKDDGTYYNESSSYGKGGYYSAAVGSYIQFLNQKNNKKISQNMSSIPLNQILYGPPGTGKTYNTVDLSVKITDRDFWETNKNDREQLILRFKELSVEGKISFTTFHQSLSYEDFIEGIKPVTDDDKNVTYEIEDGIFKSVCEQAKSLKIDESAFDWNGRSFFKISLGGKQNQEIHTKCIEDGIIALGWGGHQDLSDYIGISSWNEFKNKFSAEFPELIEESRFNTQAAFKLLTMKEGDVVVASIGNNIIDAIGVIEGAYEFDSDNVFEYYHTRKVKWIANELNTNPSRFFRKKISQQAIYEFYTADVKHEAFRELTNKKTVEEANHVLIIDEINRGNVSQIFGELITLIEHSKRLGSDEELKVILPYSKTPFGVPSNVHIIGTMNTADRSVEALDTALRRRFSFIEMLPEPNKIKSDGASNGVIDKIDLVKLLETINERIEVLVDRDHTIGHAFFMGATSLLDFKSVIADKIIPLLQEYFYGDYHKMELVIGSGFFNKKSVEKVAFAVTSDLQFEGDVYEIIDANKMTDPEFKSAIEAIKF